MHDKNTRDEMIARAGKEAMATLEKAPAILGKVMALREELQDAIAKAEQSLADAKAAGGWASVQEASFIKAGIGATASELKELHRLAADAHERLAEGYLQFFVQHLESRSK